MYSDTGTPVAEIETPTENHCKKKKDVLGELSCVYFYKDLLFILSEGMNSTLSDSRDSRCPLFKMVLTRQNSQFLFGEPHFGPKQKAWRHNSNLNPPD